MTDPADTPVMRIWAIPGSSLVMVCGDIAIGSHVLSVGTQVPVEIAPDVRATFGENEVCWFLSLVGPHGITLARQIQAKPISPKPPPTAEDILAAKFGEGHATKILELLSDAGFEVTEREWPDDDYEDDP